MPAWRGPVSLAAKSPLGPHPTVLDGQTCLSPKPRQRLVDGVLDKHAMTPVEQEQRERTQLTRRLSSLYTTLLARRQLHTGEERLVPAIEQCPRRNVGTGQTWGKKQAPVFHCCISPLGVGVRGYLPLRPVSVRQPAQCRGRF